MYMLRTRGNRPRSRGPNARAWKGFGRMSVIGGFLVAATSCGAPEQSEPDVTQALGTLETGPAGLEVAERNKMVSYLASRYAAADVAHAFTTRHGDDVDCVRGDRQPAARRGLGGAGPAAPRSAPPGAITKAAIADLERLFGFGGDADGRGRLRRCPPNTVPIKRLTLDDLARSKTLAKFHYKRPIEEPPADPGEGGGATHHYSAVRDTNENKGVYADLIVKAPFVHAGVDEFSLSQLWDRRGGTGDNRETVEAGWIVYPNKFGSGTRFFIYSTSDNYGPASGWNLENGRFSQNPGLPICVGCTVSTGSTMNLLLFKDNDNGSWWVQLNGVWVGFWNISLFDANGLQVMGDTVTWGGEIIDTHPNGQFTDTDMGSGAFSNSSSTAYQATMRWITRDNQFWNNARMDQIIQTVSNCYSLALDRSIFKIRFGGPGLNPPFCQ